MSRAGRAIEALETTLRREISALEAGDFDALAGMVQKKDRLGAELEAALLESPGAIERDRLFGLQKLIERNARGFETAMTATGAAAEQIIEVRKSLTINGKYGPSGKKRAEKTAPGAAINKVF